jgi:hypothetical protein
LVAFANLTGGTARLSLLASIAPVLKDILLPGRKWRIQEDGRLGCFGVVEVLTQSNAKWSRDGHY